MPHHALAVHGEADAALGARLAALRTELELPAEFPAEVLAAADYVITMGCGDDCAVAPHQDVRDWPVGDPAEADWERLQEIVAEIEDRVDAFWREVSGAR